MSAQTLLSPDTSKRLSIDEIETLRRWIDAGADYQPHWAYIAPTRPELPAALVLDLEQRGPGMLERN